MRNAFRIEDRRFVPCCWKWHRARNEKYQELRMVARRALVLERRPDETMRIEKMTWNHRLQDPRYLLPPARLPASFETPSRTSLQLCCSSVLSFHNPLRRYRLLTCRLWHCRHARHLQAYRRTYELLSVETEVPKVFHLLKKSTNSLEVFWPRNFDH